MQRNNLSVAVLSHDPKGLIFINPSQIAAVDQRTIQRGTPGHILMQRAAHACVRVIQSRWPRRPVVVLAGPGNNGGDGWAIASELQGEGWDVTVYSDWPAATLSGDAKRACEAAGLTSLPLQSLDLPCAPLVIDALFGAGLTRRLEGTALAAITKVTASESPVLAVDLPSGLHGASGDTLSTVAPATATVTFDGAKPGHVLGPGRTLCGELYVLPIGLALEPDDAVAHQNHPDQWQAELPLPPTAAHKYARGGVLVLGGPRHAGGAARLAAQAAAVTGAGATSIAATPQAADIYASHLDAIMVKTYTSPAELADLAASPKISAMIVGPGMGMNDTALEALKALIGVGKPMVLDADALTLLAKEKDLMASLPEETVLTPHEGEFARLYPHKEGSAMARAQNAAESSALTILLKGPTTVIASAHNIPLLNINAPSYLATAGAGDVLAGIIGALLAQGVSARTAAGAGAWIHSSAAHHYGEGLTADVLITEIPSALRELTHQNTTP